MKHPCNKKERREAMLRKIEPLLNNYWMKQTLVWRLDQVLYHSGVRTLLQIHPALAIYLVGAYVRSMLGRHAAWLERGLCSCPMCKPHKHAGNAAWALHPKSRPTREEYEVYVEC